MITPYVYSDHGQVDPGNPADWWHETVIQLRYERGDISTEAKKASAAFGDDDGTGSHKHFVPWDRIFKGLEDACVGKSRNACHTLLTNTLNFLGIADTSGLNPTTSRIAFDAWFSWACESICDWPQNLFRHDSYGDHKGTALDMPKKPYSDQLKTRLDGARKKLQDALGISIEYQVKFI